VCHIAGYREPPPPSSPPHQHGVLPGKSNSDAPNFHSGILYLYRGTFFSQLIWHDTVAVPCLLIWVGSVCRLGPRYGRFVYPSVFRTVKNFLNRVRYLWVQLGVVRFSLSLVPEGGADVSSEVPAPTRNGKGGEVPVSAVVAVVVPEWLTDGSWLGLSYTQSAL